MKFGDIVKTYDERFGEFIGSDPDCYVVKFGNEYELINKNEIVKAGLIERIVYKVVKWVRGKKL